VVDVENTKSKMMKKSRIHDDEVIEKKLSMIQSQVMQSSMMNSKMQDRKLAKIEQEIMDKVNQIEELKDFE
jgi:flagellar biosynthesis regulator FlbT